jgi:hypothetical protein
MALAALLTVALAIAAIGIVRYETRSRPGAKAIGSAVQNFRHSGTASGVDPYGTPASGVYTLHGSGTERISFPPNSQSDSAVMPATVTSLGGGCWRWHLDYNTAHAEEFVFCSTSAGLTQPTNRNIQHWDYGAFTVSNVATVTCPSDTIVLPAITTSGQVSRWSCPETNTTVAGLARSDTSARVVAVELLQVGHTEVRAAHEVQDTTVSGAQTGTVTENWWFDVATGLPLRVDRQILIHTNSPLGEITYTESGSWTMSSLSPRT